MTLIANAADRLLAAVVPHARAAAWSCPAGCYRRTCGCYVSGSGAYWYDWCAATDDPSRACTNTGVRSCMKTVWAC